MSISFGKPKNLSLEDQRSLFSLEPCQTSLNSEKKQWEKNQKIPGAIGAKAENLCSDTQVLTVQIESAPYAMKKDIQEDIVQATMEKGRETET